MRRMLLLLDVVMRMLMMMMAFLVMCGGDCRKQAASMADSVIAVNSIDHHVQIALPNWFNRYIADGTELAAIVHVFIL